MKRCSLQAWSPTEDRVCACEGATSGQVGDEEVQQHMQERDLFATNSMWPSMSYWLP